MELFHVLDFDILILFSENFIVPSEKPFIFQYSLFQFGAVHMEKRVEVIYPLS